MNQNRLHVRMGRVEFDASGSTDFVKACFAEFLSAVPVLPISDLVLDADAVRSLFRERKDGCLYPRMGLLKGGSGHPIADTLLLTLYGHALLKAERSVPASTLLKDLRAMKLATSRIDRSLIPYQHLVERAGNKSGSRYSLTDAGLLKAEEFALKMLKESKAA